MTFNSLQIAFLCFALIFVSCQNTVDSENTQQSGDWLIPLSEVYDGGPGKDGIPALTNPRFTSIADATYLKDDDLVLGVKVGDEARAYPHPILDWHEIINDEINGELLAITYCPLTGSGIAWDRIVAGKTTTFGVSGLLYNTNLIPYDRATNSNWSQMRLQCVNGPLKGRFAALHVMLETTWKTWREMYPQTKVVSSNTGYSRPYGSYPYGDYKINQNRLLFPVSGEDPRLPRKERVLGIVIGERTKAYRINSFADSIQTINDVFNGTPVVIVGSRSKNFAAAFERTFQARVLSFSPVQDMLPAVMMDSDGRKWDALGMSLGNPEAGFQLKALRSFVAYWFAWAAFYPGAEIYSQ